MKEEIFVSGRNIPNIDPYLHVWHWQIPLYLFLGGLAAGLLFFAAYFFLTGKTDKYSVAVKIAPILAPIAIVIGLLALLLDLKHTQFFWQLYTTIRFEAPMSWGAWTLLVVTPLSIIWPLLYLQDIINYFDGKCKIITAFLKWFDKLISKCHIVTWILKISRKNQKFIASILVFLSIILGVYTGILLSAFNARPLWNTSILGPLFLVSGVSTGAAAIMWMARDHFEKLAFSKIDLILIATEIFFIIHMFMGYLASSEVQQQAAELFLGGEFTAVFWGLFVGIGLILPALLEMMEIFNFKIPSSVPAFLILFGGILFRFIMVEAGQLTRYLY